jgi:ornithine decarboxylase
MKSKAPSLKPKSSTEPSGIEALIRFHLREVETPFMLIQKNVLEQQYQNFLKHLPEVIPYYAIKANPFPEIIKLFVRLGSGFDVASANEMNTVLKLGAKPRRLVFANTIKTEKDISEAKRRKVFLLTFDNEPELYKISKHHPTADVLIRIKVPNVGSLVELSLKFGADPEQAVPLLEKAQKLGLSPRGICFHVGSQCTHSQNYVDALELTSQIFMEAEKKGLKLDILDIGGGFPIQHLDSDRHPTFESIATVIRQKIRLHFDKSVKVIAEPGRFLVGRAGTLVTQVIGRTFRNNKNYYYLNSGIYTDFSGIVFDHCKYEFKTLRRGQKFLSTLAGPTCDSFDVISSSEELPELDVGNVVYVRNIGAYSSASAVPGFNGFPCAKLVLV